jgi:speckle-type POZ protein
VEDGGMPSASRKTASRCTTEAARGTHVFEIEGYSLKKGLGIRNFVRSRTFTVGGYDWAIRFYPDGFGVSSKDYITIFLELMTEGAAVRAFYSLGLIHQASQTVGFEWSRESPRLFRSCDLATRFGPKKARFVSRTELERDYVRDDCLAIQCNLVVAKEPLLSDITPVSSEIEVPPCDIAANLGKLLLDQKVGSDVTFQVGGEIFEAHKIILAARSPVFKAQFYGQMIEARMGRVTIKDMEPVIFKALLRFIYTGSVDGMGDDLNGDDMLWHLLAAADIYAIDRLKLMCESILSKNLNVETVANTLALADQHNCDRLKDVCIEFITNGNMNAVVATQGYANLKRACPSVLADILEKTSKRLKT